jgi:hypothetical protein
MFDSAEVAVHKCGGGAGNFVTALKTHTLSDMLAISAAFSLVGTNFGTIPVSETFGETWCWFRIGR